MSESDIVIKGAREHNLRSVGLTLPRGRLICFTGVSGSGKSSLAFDTLYAEGRRRYVESLSSYARQFLGTQEKPEVDSIAGLAPTISIQQKTAGDNPRSTVGTITQIYDYLRVLFARLGIQHCTKCGQSIAAQTAEQIVGRILAIPEGTKFQLLAPVVRGQKGEHRDLLEDLRRQGYARARVDGKAVGLSDNLRLDKMLRHNIELVLDRLTVSPAIRLRLGEAVDEGLRLGEGVVIVAIEGQPDQLLSSQYACAKCGLSYEAPSPQLLSFNSPIGMCLTCDGLGACTDFDVAKLIPDDSKSFDKGAVVTHAGYVSAERKRRYEAVARSIWMSLKLPWRDIPDEKRRQFLFGTDADVSRTAKTSEGHVHYSQDWGGIIGELRTAYKSAVGEIARKYYEKFMVSVPCPDCRRARLNPQALAVRLVGTEAPGSQLRGLNIAEACGLSVADAQAFFNNLELTPLQRTIGGDAIKEVVTRLQFLINVGLEYLSLDRPAPTLSGGEAQRIRLAGQVGCGLVGVLYILDEPSIGLHPRDNTRLISALKSLRDMGNTVIVVEHDEETMRAADQIVDFGPGPGVKGGEVVFQGGWDELLGAKNSETADYLTGRKEIAVPKQRRPVAKPAGEGTATKSAKSPAESSPVPPVRKRKAKSPVV
jgi:excinuclease ABC subunit A